MYLSKCVLVCICVCVYMSVYVHMSVYGHNNVHKDVGMNMDVNEYACVWYIMHFYKSHACAQHSEDSAGVKIVLYKL